MAVCFCYLVKSDLSCVHVFRSLHLTSYFLHGTRKTRSRLTGCTLQICDYFARPFLDEVRELFADQDNTGDEEYDLDRKVKRSGSEQVRSKH